MLSHIEIVVVNDGGGRGGGGGRHVSLIHGGLQPQSRPGLSKLNPATPNRKPPKKRSQNANMMSLLGLSTKWRELVGKAKAKQLKPDEYNGGTFTITNLGMFGKPTAVPTGSLSFPLSVYRRFFFFFLSLYVVGGRVKMVFVV